MEHKGSTVQLVLGSVATRDLKSSLEELMGHSFNSLLWHVLGPGLGSVLPERGRVGSWGGGGEEEVWMDVTEKQR